MFELPKLTYSYDALEPHIDARTMEIHYSKHHATYIAKLNEALQLAPDWESKSIEYIVANYNEAPENIRNALRNHGGGHYNHSLFWHAMKPQGGGEPQGKLADAIIQSFGGLAEFQNKFNNAALSVFGSGWSWLVKNNSGQLAVVITPNQDNPLSNQLTPLLGLDVWEHAYYLKYQNKRADYVNAWWQVIDWEAVSSRFTHAPSLGN